MEQENEARGAAMMRLSKMIPSRREVVEFDAIKTDFSHYTEGWRLARSRAKDPLDKCGWCKEPFKDGDTIALGFRVGHKNMVLCQTCATLGASGEGRKA